MRVRIEREIPNVKEKTRILSLFAIAETPEEKEKLEEVYNLLQNYILDKSTTPLQSLEQTKVFTKAKHGS